MQQEAVNAEQALAQPTANWNTACAAADQAAAAKADADNAVTAAQAAVSAAETEKAAAQQKLADGSFAFFDAMGATDALNALTQSTYASKTIKGDPTDATSLENMKATIQWLKRCNELRSQHGLAPLMVSDRLMAMAQADANYSDTVIGHALQFSMIGENCAWSQPGMLEKQDIISTSSVPITCLPDLRFVPEKRCTAGQHIRRHSHGMTQML